MAADISRILGRCLATHGGAAFGERADQRLRDRQGDPLDITASGVGPRIEAFAEVGSSAWRIAVIARLRMQKSQKHRERRPFEQPARAHPCGIHDSGDSCNLTGSRAGSHCRQGWPRRDSERDRVRPADGGGRRGSSARRSNPGRLAVSDRLPRAPEPGGRFRIIGPRLRQRLRSSIGRFHGGALQIGGEAAGMRDCCDRLQRLHSAGRSFRLRGRVTCESVSSARSRARSSSPG
jgi:hypothetical protein